MHKKCKCKNAMQNKYKSKIIYRKFKTQIAENAFGHPLDSHLGGVQDMQSRLPGFHAFRFLNLPHMQYVQEWVSVRFGFLSLHQHLNGHIDFSGKGWWLAQPPSPSPKRCFSGKLTEGPFLCFFLLFCCLFFAFLLLSICSLYFPIPFVLHCFSIFFKM